MHPAPKTCRICGRRIEWRRSLAADWDSVTRCSAACRKRRLGRVDEALEAAITELLAARTGTICPSEAARRVRPEDWRPLMERARMAARRLVVAGEVVITQRGRVVDPSTAKGPIRVRRA